MTRTYMLSFPESLEDSRKFIKSPGLPHESLMKQKFWGGLGNKTSSIPRYTQATTTEVISVKFCADWTTEAWLNSILVLCTKILGNLEDNTEFNLVDWIFIQRMEY